MQIDHGTDTGWSIAGRNSVPVIAVVLIVGFLVSCASVRNPPGTATAQFFQNPDRVWEGIQLAMETLDYVAESSNRTDGVIRAVKPADDKSPGIALEINQVVYTQDQVNVFVRGVSEDLAAAPDQAILDKAAQDFVTVLKRKLEG